MLSISGLYCGILLLGRLGVGELARERGRERSELSDFSDLRERMKRDRDGKDQDAQISEGANEAN